MKIDDGVRLAPYTSLGLGGEARHLAHCTSEEEIREALGWGRSRGLPVHVLGGGSNTVFDDAGYDGLVLRVELLGVRIEESNGGARVSAAAGEDWDALVRRCIEADLSGVECMSGIPGQVGATPMQNVGAYGQEVCDTIVEVRAIERGSGEGRTFANGECGFGYRTSRFKAEDRDRYIVTRVTYRLPRKHRPEIRYPELQRRLEAEGVDVEGLPAGAPASTAVREAVLDLRRGKAMLLEAGPDARSAGSFFLNPVLTEDQLAEVRDRWSQRGGAAAEMPVFPAGDGLHKVAAAWLVERSGFSKGTRRGGAAISERHALALVNRGGTSSDLLALAGEVSAGVRETFGVRLEPEPVYVPPHGAPGGGSSQESG